VLDVGGAAGVYARWLAGAGYTVHLIDPSPLHVQQAAAIAPGPGEGPIASVRPGDARRLPREDASADAVLLLGPLYHLTSDEDRNRAWREAGRVLRPGGIAVGAGISRFASFLDWLHRKARFTAELTAIAAEDLRSGQHRNATGDPQYFTTAYFHRPEELRAEPGAAGLEVLDLVAVEGPGAFVGDLDDWWDDPERRERVFTLLRSVEREPALLGVSPHLLVLARKP
jgi:SAM-dependent methyltransferase